MNAYPKSFVDTAMRHMAAMFDFAIEGIGIPRESYPVMFSHSRICHLIENGTPKYILGMCGEDVAIRVIEEATGVTPEVEPEENYGRSPDYWCGKSICYYQWLRNIPYKEIFEIASYKEIYDMYDPLHEADITKFVDVMDKRRIEQKRETRLKEKRRLYGLSQSELSRESGVSLRSVQMYEQRRKDINKAQIESIASLAKVLGCRAEDLMEPLP